MTREVVNGRRFELTIRENSSGRYVAFVKVLDEPFLPPKLRSASFTGLSDGEVEQKAREWMLWWKK